MAVREGCRFVSLPGSDSRAQRSCCPYALCLPTPVICCKQTKLSGIIEAAPVLRVQGSGREVRSMLRGVAHLAGG